MFSPSCSFNYLIKQQTTTENNVTFKTKSWNTTATTHTDTHRAEDQAQIKDENRNGNEFWDMLGEKNNNNKKIKKSGFLELQWFTLHPIYCLCCGVTFGVFLSVLFYFFTYG